MINFKLINFKLNHKRLILKILLCFIFVLIKPLYCLGVTKGEFLTELLTARGIEYNADFIINAGANDLYKTKNTKNDDKDKNNKNTLKAENAADFVLKTGIVTDYVKNLNEKITRREALRWCIQALGLAFEADVLSNFNFNLNNNFSDIGSFTKFERGCINVAVNMRPQLFVNAAKFNSGQNLSDKDMNILLERVKNASGGLTLEFNIALADGITLLIHRDGVFSGVPKWRAYADGFSDKDEAENAQKFFKSQGYETSAIHPLYEWFLRTPVIDEYNEIRNFINLAKKRGFTTRVLPSFTNPKTEILPRYWTMLIIDPSYWQMTPVIIPDEAGKVLAPLSEIVTANKNKNIKAAINAGFFAMTKKRFGYPIGFLKIGGEQLNAPYAGRGCLAWNNYNNYSSNGTDETEETEEIEAMLEIYNNENSGQDDNNNKWDEMENIIQAGPVLIIDGQARAENENFNNTLISARHPRSVVGVTDEGFWFFMAMDGRNGLHSSGATINELTDILMSYNVQYALNLDGGGSTEIIFNNKILNFPSEGKERPISYGLAIAPIN